MIEKTFIPLRVAAGRLGVPISWLKAESQAGRIPHLKIGRSYRFNPDTVEQVLFERAAQGPCEAQEVARD
jgi:excisionase family DNA binding protein